MDVRIQELQSNEKQNEMNFCYTACYPIVQSCMTDRRRTYISRNHNKGTFAKGQNLKGGKRKFKRMKAMNERKGTHLAAARSDKYIRKFC